MAIQAALPVIGLEFDKDRFDAVKLQTSVSESARIIGDIIALSDATAPLSWLSLPQHAQGFFFAGCQRVSSEHEWALESGGKIDMRF